MLTAERRQAILERLQKDGRVFSADLSQAFGVSEDTIRRDLREMAETGQLNRVHGGALPLTPVIRSFPIRMTEARSVKAALGAAAAQLIAPGQTVIMDGGTTALEVAHHLPVDLRATVITNSTPVANALAGHAHVEVILLGGKFLKESLVTVGAATVAALQTIQADLCIMGVCSLHPSYGVGAMDWEESLVKRAMVQQSAEVMAVAPAGRVGTRSPYVVAPVRAVSYLVTEPSVDPAPYEAHGVSVIHA